MGACECVFGCARVRACVIELLMLSVILVCLFCVLPVDCMTAC